MRGLWRRLMEVFRRRQLDREADDEMAHHLELLIARKRDAGLPQAEARRQAQAEVGTVQSARELIAEGRTGFPVEQVLREIAYAARVLRRAPAVTALSVATIGAGIGASTILFALVNTVLLRPLPYPDSDRLVSIFETNAQAGVDRAGAASGNINDWRGRTTMLDGVAGYYAMGRTLTVGASSEVLITAQVSEDFFPLMRVAPLFGRTFTADETRRAQYNSAAAPTGTDPVVVVSHGAWRQQLGGDPGVVGKTVILERRPFTVIGVMPDGFAMPKGGVQMWIPWDVSGTHPRDQRYLGAIARLRPGASLGQAEAELNSVAATLGREHPKTNQGWGVQLSPLADETIGGTATVLWVLFAAVGLVLLVACANVALLSLMRGLDRSHEAAVRLALGASRGRLLREFLLESVLLSAMGGALGATLAVAGLRLLPALTADMPRIGEIALDSRTLAFLILVTTGSALLSGLPQAWRRARIAALREMAERSPRSSGATRHFLRDSIVVTQVALAVVLLAAAGLLVRSFLRLQSADPGFDPRSVLVAPIFLDSQAYGSGERSRAYYRTLFEHLSAIPGVSAVGGATTVPTSPLGPDFERPVWPEGTDPGSPRRVPASVRMVTPGYFQALSLRLAGGRAIDERDQPESPRVVMVNEALADKLWPGQRAVGQQLVVDYSTAGTYPYEVIGVVGNVRFRGPRSVPAPEVFLPHAQRPYLILNVVLKTSADPRALIPAVRSVLAEVDPQKPAHGLYLMEDLVGATYARDRQAMVTLLVFAATAIGLAVLSVYGVLSQRVRERSREIGIRMALGADTAHVVGWVVRAGLRLVAFGAGTGMLAAWALSGTLEGLLFGVAPTDAVTAVVVVTLLSIVGLLATLLPAWRATRIDPVAVLRLG